MKLRIDFWRVVCMALMAVVSGVFSFACNHASAQNPPVAAGQVVGQPVQQGQQGQYVQQGQQGKHVQHGHKQLTAVYSTHAYYSSKLKAQLSLQQMTIPGYTFWGSRVVGMDHDSPLHQIHFHVGDVITRLDGHRIGTGKYWTGHYWWLPQAERSFGRTEVRNVRSGHQHAQNDFVQLGQPHFPPAPNNGVVVP